MKLHSTHSLPRLYAICVLLTVFCSTAAEPVSGWLAWRGNNQNGTSDEKGLPDKWGKPLWRADIAGQSSPVVANGKLFVMGYEGVGPDLQEGIYCVDAETGKILWSDRHNDYLSDIIYTRYASSSPSIDPETGNVFTMGTQGLLSAYTPDGKVLWRHSMMEEYGRLTFPNGRTPSPVVDGDLVIVGAMTANWGAHGPGGHRFYAFNKNSGDLIFASWPGERPKDSSFSTPQLGWYNNQRVYWSGGGDGAVYCANARTGDPIWRYPASHGGLNASVLAYKDMVIAVHGAENLDASTIGRMIALRPGDVKAGADGKPAALTKANEVWRQDVAGTSTSPILVGNRIYQVTDMPAKLFCVDADTGKVLWSHQLGLEERQSSPVYGDGKLYVPLQEGHCFIVKPTDTGAEVLDKIMLEGADSGTGICQGTPGIYRGRIYIQTTRHLYCFGPAQPGALPTPKPKEKAPDAGPLARFIVTPAEFLIRPEQSQSFKLIGIDANGQALKETYDEKKAKWEKYIPPTARVKTMLNGEVAEGTFKADPATKPSAGAIRAELNGIAGVTRGRVLQALPIKQDFESFELAPRETEPKDMFAFPPLPWIGARFKWEIKEKDGNKCLVKTIDDKFFQRAITFVSHPDTSNYTIQADVMSDGQVRKVGGKEKIQKMSEVGLINQRYIISLKGPAQQIEVNSNLERLQVNAPFAWSPNSWYTLKARVDIDPKTGEGVIRGKAWKKGEPEPEKWTIEVPHKTAHKNGSPGLYGLSPTDMPVYVDNLVVTKN
ncbi:MAG TPA: PQQ-binding-like beta-propeller repeat protein [Planctomycetota bacterium]|nr:PQQ-binding-like beta-propeller repeat protein [Planctomycetota bacterium]